MSTHANGFSLPSQLLQRNEEQLEAEHLLIAGMPDDRWSLTLEQHPEIQKISAFTTDFDVYAGLQAHWSHRKAEHLHFGADYPHRAQHDLLVLYARKGRDETDLLLKLLLPSLKPGARIFLVGENKAGIKSQGRLLAPLGAHEKVDSARHCTLFAGAYDNPQPAFNLDNVEKRYPITIAGTPLTICTLPGVFSHGRLDEGTELFLKQLPKERLAGSILDFGCGAGVIAAWALASAQKPVTLTLLDNSALALEAARRTLAANGFDHAISLSSNGLSEVQAQYDFLLTNPPFHTGVKTNYRITEEFIQQMPQHLFRGGELWLVANSFLKYPPLIERSLGNCLKITDNRRFSIYQAVKK